MTALIMVVIGLGQAGRMSLSNILLMSYTEPSLQGRVMSVYMMESSLVSFGTFLVGVLAEVVGVQGAIGTTAVLLIVITAVGTAVRAASASPALARCNGPAPLEVCRERRDALSDGVSRQPERGQPVVGRAVDGGRVGEAPMFVVRGTREHRARLCSAVADSDDVIPLLVEELIEVLRASASDIDSHLGQRADGKRVDTRRLGTR